MPAPDDIYRGEALEHHQRYQGNRGSLLRVSPFWSQWTYWLLLTVVGAGLAYVTFGTVHGYATGPAVLHVEGGNGADGAWSVIALLPGNDRPLLRAGMAVRVEIGAYPNVPCDLTIDSVGDAIVGPAEIRRALGDSVADVIPVHGPVVVVRAHLPSPGLTVRGHTYPWYEGLQGTAEVRVHTEPMLFTLVPGLRALFEPS